MSITVKITTLHNQTTTLECDPGLSVEQLKGKYQDAAEKPEPPEKQQLWFGCPAGTDGSQSATDFKWWAKSIETGSKDKSLMDAMAARPLVEGANDQTVGGLAAMSDKEGALQAYLILNLRKEGAAEAAAKSKSDGCCSVQ